jgi:hypothetical protein
MALTFGRDGGGPWVSVDCDKRGCYGHVTIRPCDPSVQGAVETAMEAIDQALEGGWCLNGRAWCPRHAQWQQERLTGRLGGDFPWVAVVNGASAGRRTVIGRMAPVDDA